MLVKIFDNKEELGKYAAQVFKDVITEVENPVLGLATGSSPMETYNELIKMYNNKEISFKNVKSYNLDEYEGMSASDDQSYAHFMNVNLFDHVDIDKNNTFVPAGTGDLKAVCDKYNQDLAANPRDLQILGIGTNGHIAFNEPGTSFDQVTHVVDLDEKTRQDNARFFASIDDVPTHAVSMGLSNIVASKKIVLVATGASKAWAVNQLINGEVTTDIPATILRDHADVIVLVDKEAAQELSK